MEWTVCTASSDSDEEEGAPSNTGQQGSLYGLVQSSTADDTQRSIGFELLNEAVSTKNSLDSMGSVKAKPGEKPPHKNIQHFRKKDRLKVTVPRCMLTTMAVTISEEDEPEDLTRQTICGEKEELLVTEEDFGGPAEELECHSSEFGVSREQNPRQYELQNKKRKFTEDGQGQASKLAKTSEHPQKNQMSCASTESGESTTDLTRWQWSEGFQSGQLEENDAAEEPINCTPSTESFSPSSQLLEQKEERTGKVTCNCAECINKYIFILTQHRIRKQTLGKPYKCPQCKKRFLTEDGKHKHLLDAHNVEQPKKCSDCNEMFKNESLLSIHQLICHIDYDTKGFSVDEALDFPWEGRE